MDKKVKYAENFAETFYDSESKELRSNLWTFCVYPGDSLPKDYLNIIDNLHIPCLISPVHDADKNGNGMEKKKHIHCMIYYGKGANKSFDQVSKVVKKLGGCQPEAVMNSAGLIRYFIHRDNPEKARRSKGMDRDWTVEDLKGFAGFEYMDAFETQASDNAIYEYIEQLILDERITNFASLIMHLRNSNLKTELNFIRRHSIYFDKLINGLYHRIKDAVPGAEEETKK